MVGDVCRDSKQMFQEMMMQSFDAVHMPGASRPLASSEARSILNKCGAVFSTPACTSSLIALHTLGKSCLGINISASALLCDAPAMHTEAEVDFCPVCHMFVKRFADSQNVRRIGTGNSSHATARSIVSLAPKIRG
jgi:hypothetical protein